MYVFVDKRKPGGVRDETSPVQQAGGREQETEAGRSGSGQCLTNLHVQAVW